MDANYLVFLILGSIVLYFGAQWLSKQTWFEKINYLPSPAIKAAGVEFQALRVEGPHNQAQTSFILPSDRRLPTQREYEAFMDEFGFTGMRQVSNIDNKVVARDRDGRLLAVNSGSTPIYNP